MKYLIIIPAFNEEKNIAAVIKSIRQVFPDGHVLVVNDGSWDRTADVAESLGCEVISLPFNMGIGAAVQTGFLYAKKYGYNYAVQVDADGQHLPEEIGKIIQPVLNGEYDVIIGSRYIEENKYKTPLLRRLGMVILSGINSLILNKKITDTTSGFRAYNRRAIEFLADNYPDDYPEPEAVVLLARNGFRVGEVGVKMNARMEGRSSITPFRSIYYMVKVTLAIFIDLFKDRHVTYTPEDKIGS